MWMTSARILAQMATLVVALPLCVIALLLLRRTWSAESRERARGHAVGWMMAFRAILLGMALTLGYCAAGVVVGNLPSPLTLSIFVLLIVTLVLLCVLLRDRAFARVVRLFRRGDEAGAIFELQAELDRYSLKIGSPISPTSGKATIPPKDQVRIGGYFKAMGDLLHEQEESSRARDWYEGAIRIGGPTPGHVGALGVTLIQTGRVEEGLALMRQACTSPLDQNSLERCQMVVALGAALVKHRRYSEARLWLERARATVRVDSLLHRQARRKLARTIEILWDRASQDVCPS